MVCKETRKGLKGGRCTSIWGFIDIYCGGVVVLVYGWCGDLFCLFCLVTCIGIGRMIVLPDLCAWFMFRCLVLNSDVRSNEIYPFCILYLNYLKTLLVMY